MPNLCYQICKYNQVTSKTSTSTFVLLMPDASRFAKQALQEMSVHASSYLQSLNTPARVCEGKSLCLQMQPQPTDELSFESTKMIFSPVHRFIPPVQSSDCRLPFHSIFHSTISFSIPVHDPVTMHLSTVWLSHITYLSQPHHSLQPCLHQWG